MRTSLLRATGPTQKPAAGMPLLQRKRSRGCQGHDGIPSVVDEVLRSPGEPLDLATRTFFESRSGHAFGRVGVQGRQEEALEQEADRAADQLTRPALAAPGPGHDFSRIRIHADGRAAGSARAVGALAYTVGNHIVFGAGQYSPRSDAGRRLLAHELTHTVQQGVTGPHLARQCDPAWAALPWSQRVANARGMTGGTPRNQCMTDMIDEALYPNVTVEEHTNTSPSVAAAITANRYVEWGTLSDLHVNFDQNLNAKIGNPNLFGVTEFRTTPATATTPSSFRVFIVLGPTALDPVGPQHTRMAFEHENEHASDFLMQLGMRGSTPHAATTGEELRIHTAGFSQFFLTLWTIDNTSPGSFQISNNFFPIFTNYAAPAPGTTDAQRDSAFDSIKMFFDVRVVGVPCNVMKFKIWLQMMQNARPANDALIARLNAFPGMGLTRGTSPANHLNIALGCT